MILKLSKVCIYDDPWLTMTYLTARSNLVACTFEWENCSKVIDWENLGTNDQKEMIYSFENILTPGGCLAPRGILSFFLDT